jgi:selenocysteine lyase/cysteine desulfurase
VQKGIINMNWRAEFADFEDVTYLNLATQCPIPLVSARAAQSAIEWKKLPHTIPDDSYLGLPHRVRTLLAQVIGAEPHEIALTSGASSGLHTVANAVDWRPDDEVLLAAGEFPAHRSTWEPMAAAGRLKVKTIHPKEKFITSEDFLPHITSRTRLISTSLVRFDNAVRIDAPKLAAACHAVGAWLLLDLSQCAGAVPMNVNALGADFAVCAGYKWLLSPYGSGFFWAKEAVTNTLRGGPIYWQTVEGAGQFSALGQSEMKPPRGARRWDAAETANFFNLAAMEKSVEFVLHAGVENIGNHNNSLMQLMMDRLPRDRCVLASPASAEQRGPYACIAARNPEKTNELYARLREAKVIVGLREGSIRVAPHLFNSERDIDRLIGVVSV